MSLGVYLNCFFSNLRRLVDVFNLLPHFFYAANALPKAINTTAPNTETKTLYRLNPVTPDAPKRFIIKPPTMPPRMPRIISIIVPCLWFDFIIIDATHPEIKPRIAHNNIFKYRHLLSCMSKV